MGPKNNCFVERRDSGKVDHSREEQTSMKKVMFNVTAKKYPHPHPHHGRRHRTRFLSQKKKNVPHLIAQSSTQTANQRFTYVVLLPSFRQTNETSGLSKQEKTPAESRFYGESGSHSPSRNGHSDKKLHSRASPETNYPKDPPAPAT